MGLMAWACTGNGMERHRVQYRVLMCIGGGCGNKGRRIRGAEDSIGINPHGSVRLFSIYSMRSE